MAEGSGKHVEPFPKKLYDRELFGRQAGTGPAEGAPSMLWVVAGCLFEISFPVTGAGHWRWTDGGDQVTLLAETVRDGRQHLRFRAEAAGAEAGAVELRFVREGEDLPHVTSVRIASEQP